MKTYVLKTMTMKILTLAILAGTILGESPALAQGQRPMSQAAVANINSFGPATGGFNVWCRDRLQELSFAESNAVVLLNTGRYTDALATLEAGLTQAALQVQTSHQGAMTVSAVLRGVELTKEMKAASTGQINATRSLVFFLLKYYQFIRDVANNLDRLYYSPMPCGYCNSTGNYDFEQRYMQYSRKQLSLVIDQLTQTVYQAGQRVIYPVGNVTAYLKALELSTGYASSDILYSVFASRYACAAEALGSVSYNLTLYLAGQGGYIDEFWAVQMATQQARSANQTCHSTEVRYGQGHTTQERISGSRRLNSGYTETVRLGTQKFIKKLIINAEGIGHDGMFNVMVNGDVKGTIYVPGRDPAYIVTVQEYTDHVTLISSYGNVRILSIEAVYEY